MSVSEPSGVAGKQAGQSLEKFCNTLSNKGLDCLEGDPSEISLIQSIHHPRHKLEIPLKREKEIGVKFQWKVFCT